MSQSPGSPSRNNDIAGTSLDGLRGISDGIFSVGMTLLVLGLAVPTLSSHPTIAPNQLTDLGSLPTQKMPRVRARLFDESQARMVARLVRGRVLIAQGLYAFSAALSIFFLTWVSIALIVLVQLNYVIAPRIPVLHRF